MARAGRPKGIIKTGGRQKGGLNRTTRQVKEVFASVFNELQSDANANLFEWAKSNPTEFYKLASKLIPFQLANDPDNPISIILGSDPGCKPLGYETKEH